MPVLVLYTRQGCCLCEGLEEKLRSLEQPPTLELIDVDVDPQLQARFGLEVPLLALRRPDGREVLLPRVPPRLAGQGLWVWLQKNGFSGGSA
jgi:hypothetical protein